MKFSSLNTSRITPALAGVLGVLVLLAGMASPAFADNNNVCDGFSKDMTLSRLGTSGAISKTGAPTWQHLARQFERHRADLEGILEAQGLGKLAPALFEAVSTGKVTERNLTNGETFQWMANRKGGGAATSKGPVCLNSRKTYDAFEVTVQVIKEEKVADVSCRFTATADCRNRTLSVKVPPGSAGVTVEMDGTAVIKAGSTSWDAPFENRFDSSPTFIARAENRGTKTVETYTFVIPKVCLNLALANTSTTEEPGDVRDCQEKVTVDACPKPYCKITPPVGPRKKTPFSATIEGEGTLKIDRIVDEKRGTEMAYSDGMSVKKKGFYTLYGSSETEFGDKETCSARFCIGRDCPEEASAVAASSTSREPRDGAWTLRGFAGPLLGDDELRTARTRADGTSERTKFQMGDGGLVGVGAEYHFNNRVGLEAAVMAGRIDSMFTLDLNDDWGMESDDVDFFAITVGPNFHLTPNSRFDFYVGPFIGLFSASEGNYTVLGENVEIEFDDEITFGAQAGLGIPFGESPWGLNLGLRYFALSLEENSGEGRELDLDPIAATVGFAYRF